MSDEHRRLKAFISYSSKDKKTAFQLKQALAEIGIDAFLAHDDIHISEEWRERILAELEESPLFIPLLSKNFKESDWASQEIGVAVHKRSFIFPLLLDGTIPYGFISNLQGRRLRDPIVLEVILEPLIKKYPRTIIPPLINKMSGAASYRHAEELMAPLVPHFSSFSDEEIDAFVEAAKKNGQIWAAALCKTEYLPKFIKINRERIAPKKLSALTYQIDNQMWSHQEK